MSRLMVPTSIDGVMRPQPRPRRVHSTLTRRGEYAVLIGVLLGLTLLVISAYLCPVYIVVGAR